MNELSTYPLNARARLIGATGALHGLIAVIVLAASAHVAGSMDAAALLQRGGQIELFHALAVFAALNIGGRMPALLFTTGSALFAIPLYLHGFFDISSLSFLAPIGGMALLVGWVCLAWNLLSPLPKTA